MVFNRKSDIFNQKKKLTAQFPELDPAVLVFETKQQLIKQREQSWKVTKYIKYSTIVLKYSFEVFPFSAYSTVLQYYRGIYCTFTLAVVTS